MAHIIARVLRSNSMKAIAAIDFETTGLDPVSGFVIEGAVALLEVENSKTLGHELEVYSSFNDPGCLIPAEISELTGITNEMVRGHKLDWQKFNAILKKADLIIAHNAKFDRGWAERHGEFLSPAWGCTHSMIDWRKTHKMPCGTLRHIAWEHGYFPTSHRALDDVRTMLHVLKLPMKVRPQETYFEELVRNATIGRRLILARGSAFEKKDALKARQFSWSGMQKVWWRLVLENEWAELKEWLERDIYNGRPLYETIPQIDYLAADFRTKYRLD